MLRAFGAFAFLVATLACQPLGFAADRQLEIAPAKPVGGEKRVALVIGNSAYKSAPLRNPVNDARAIAKALAKTGFKVTELEDASQGAMFRAIRSFGDELAAGGVGLFYYAGHGMQVRGKNFLIPVNADIEREDEVEYQAVDANLVLSKMDTAKNALNLMILDACRNNPFARSFRSATQGLAQMDAPSGTLIAFATAPGSVAADGNGQNGIYTQHLLENLDKPGLPIEELFKAVRNGVAKDTDERQIPWESSSLRGDFYFVPGQKALSADEQKREIEKAVTERVAADRAEQQKQMQRMISDLLSKQRAEFEAELRKRGETIARPAPAPTPSPIATAPSSPNAAPVVSKPTAPPAVQVSSTAPNALVDLGVDNPRFPKIGDYWEYDFVDAYGYDRRHARVEVSGVSDEGILDSGGFTDEEKKVRAHSAGPELVFYDGILQFSPYLLSFGDGKKGEQWRSMQVRNVPPICWVSGNICTFDGHVEGSETVKVAAGTFKAVKVVVDLNVPGNWRQYIFWYSEAAKRLVKAVSRRRAGTAGSGQFFDYDIELTSFHLQSAPAPARSLSRN